MSDLTARQRAEMPAGTATILNRRTLQSDFRRLDQILEPGQSVLDVGCGTGAITVGIAEKVGGARVVGLDRNPKQIEQAQGTHQRANLEFVCGDIYDLPYQNEFDVVVCARVLQWLNQPLEAITQMIQCLKPGGTLLILDYNHIKTVLEPRPPPAMLEFRRIFEAWRADAGMDLEIADHLEGLFQQAGLSNIQVHSQLERSTRGDPDFAVRISLWAEVAAARGPQLVEEGWLSEETRAQAEHEFRTWTLQEARVQELYLLCVEGVKSDSRS